MNTLCGVALLEALGKHNGTVKGRQYFECEDKHGVFVPLRKVSIIPSTLREKIQTRLNSLSSNEEGKQSEDDERETEEVFDQEDDEMRITVQSYKAPQKLTRSSQPTTVQKDSSINSSRSINNSLSTSSERQTTYSNSSCDSGIESPTRIVASERSLRSRRSKLPPSTNAKTKKNIVVSSFITESPQKPVLFNSFDEESIPLDDSLDLPKGKFNNRNAFSEKMKSKSQTVEISQNVFENGAKEQLNSEPITTKPTDDEENVEISETIVENVLVEPVVETQVELTPPPTPILVDEQSDAEDGKTKIPKRVASTAKLFETFHEQDNKKPITNSPTTSMSLRKTPSNTKAPFVVSLKLSKTNSTPLTPTSRRFGGSSSVTTNTSVRQPLVSTTSVKKATTAITRSRQSSFTTVSSSSNQPQKQPIVLRTSLTGKSSSSAKSPSLANVRKSTTGNATKLDTSKRGRSPILYQCHKVCSNKLQALFFYFYIKIWILISCYSVFYCLVKTI